MLHPTTVISVTSFNLLPPALRRTIHDAYDGAMEALDARRADDKWLFYETMRVAIVRHIVEQARHGECDVERLRENALETVHIKS